MDGQTHVKGFTYFKLLHRLNLRVRVASQNFAVIIFAFVTPLCQDSHFRQYYYISNQLPLHKVTMNCCIRIQVVVHQVERKYILSPKQ